MSSLPIAKLKSRILFTNLRMLKVSINGLSKGTLGSYLNKGMINRLLKSFKHKK